VSSLERKLRLRREFLHWLYDASDGEDDRMQDESDFLAQSDATEPELDALIRHLEGERLVRTFLHLGGLLPAGVELTGMGVLEVESERRGLGPRESEDTGPLSTGEKTSPVATAAASLSGAAAAEESADGTVAVNGGGIGSDGAPALTAERDNGHATVGLEDELKVASYLTAFRVNLDRLGLDEDAYAQAFADMNTLEAQLRAPHPHLSVVRELALALHATLRAGTDDAARRAIQANPLPW
jgi:hypothetical protein